jgi:hypothetical protein
MIRKSWRGLTELVIPSVARDLSCGLKGPSLRSG